MSAIDRQRIAAPQILFNLGWTFDGSYWNAPAIPETPLLREADTMEKLLLARSSALGTFHSSPALVIDDVVVSSPEELEHIAIADAIDAYERARFALHQRTPLPASGVKA